MNQACPINQLWFVQVNFNRVDCWWFFAGYLCRGIFMSDMELDVPCRQKMMVSLLNNWYGVLKIWEFASLIWRMIRMDQKLQARVSVHKSWRLRCVATHCFVCVHGLSVYPDILQKSWRAWKLRGLFRKILKQTFTKQQGNFYIAMTLMK